MHILKIYLIIKHAAAAAPVCSFSESQTQMKKKESDKKIWKEMKK